jgi:flagellar basal body-associated protein FliL
VPSPEASKDRSGLACLIVVVIIFAVVGFGYLILVGSTGVSRDQLLEVPGYAPTASPSR